MFHLPALVAVLVLGAGATHHHPSPAPVLHRPAPVHVQLPFRPVLHRGHPA